ncbi:type IV secretion system protein [Methylophilus sp. QUAN]|uniref:type IV secretion system protein n=1 Tax=Methylophilus sp. QUAN TaxID=2781020 RepID=UPI0018901784|nr:type IV secretion system protein [Methylophilus sp. QUAN]MBF4990989.1 type IV secretion system protein [Methylophilus sp. QUAN]
MSQFETALSTAMNQFFTNIQNFGPMTLSSEGMQLFGLLAVISISYMGLRLMMESGNLTNIMGSLIQSLLMIGLVFWLVTPQSYLAIWGTGNVADTSSALTGSLNVIAGKFVPDGENISKVITSNALMVLNKSMLLVNAWSSTFKQLDGFLDVIEFITANLVAFIFIFCAVIGLLVASIIYLAVGVYSQFMIVVALTLGPIMIPWLLLPATSFIFDGWLRFLIIAGLTKVIGAMLIGITHSVLSNVISNVQAAQNYDVLMVSAMLAFLMSLLIAYLMSQIPSIASALVSGGSGANLMRGISSGQKMAGSGGQALGQGASAAGQGLQNAGASLSAASGNYSKAASMASSIDGKNRIAQQAMAMAGKGLGGVTQATGAGVKMGGRGMTSVSNGGRVDVSSGSKTKG